LSQVGGTPCPEPTDYFAGGYTVPDGTPPSGPPPGEFVDTGKIRGCTLGNDPNHIRGRYESNSSGGSGNIDLTLTSPTAWTGTFTVDGATGQFAWRGTFDKHFEDGADDPSIPPYGGTTPAETPPPETPPPVTVGGDVDQVVEPACEAAGYDATACQEVDQEVGQVVEQCLEEGGDGGAGATCATAAGAYLGNDCQNTGCQVQGDENSVSITGTAKADVLKGTPGDDTIRGGRGNDTLVGKGGDDRLLGGKGNDRALGGPGDDFISGGQGGDGGNGGPGDDLCRSLRQSNNCE
jgi:Ca2+-binding RTX toxin-like protein